MSSFIRGNFVGLHRVEEVDRLQEKHPSAFLLLCLIARRARYTHERCHVTGLSYGEAFIGDYKKAGLKSISAYRYAKKKLEELGLCAFRGYKTGTNRGTVATLMPQRIFSIDGSGTTIGEAIAQPTRDQQATNERPLTTREPVNQSNQEPSNDSLKSSNGKSVVDLPHKSEGFRLAWSEWVKYQKEINHPFPESTKTRQLSKLAELTEKDAIAKIEKSIEKGWRSLFFDEDNRSFSKPSNQPQQTVAELMEGKSINMIKACDLNE